MALSKKDRLDEFLRRLRACPAARDANEARHQVEEVLNAVEDEHSGVPNDPEDPNADERMFPPSDDFLVFVPERDDLMRFRHVRHDTTFGRNGAIEIRIRKTGEVIFEKPGHDGGRI
jgi:hypothetical protein